MSVLAKTIRHVLGEWLLLSNSAALVIGAAFTAALGFLFWWFAARNFPPHAVGLAAAAISLMNLIGLIGEIGLGTLLMGESLRRAREAPGLISAALLAALASSILFGAACIVLADLSSLKLGSFAGSFGYGVLFVAGCAIAGFVLTIDCALVGLLRSSVQMHRKMIFSVLKLGLLPVLAFATVLGPGEVTIFLAWVLGNLLSVLLLALFPICRSHAMWSAPDFAALRRQAPDALGHHLLNLGAEGPGLILPFLVTVVFAADINAAFYAAWMIFSVVLLVPAALTTMLFTMGSVQPAAIASRMKFSLRLCALTALAAGVGFVFLSNWILSWFGASYASIGGPMLEIFGLGAFAVALKFHYIAIQRLRGRMLLAAVVVGAGGVAELALATLGAHLGGLSGFTWGWLCAAWLQAVFVAPSVLRAARSDNHALDIRDTASRAAGPIPFEPLRYPARGRRVPLERRARTLILRQRR